jgi:hypothetical protein
MPRKTTPTKTKSHVKSKNPNPPGRVGYEPVVRYSALCMIIAGNSPNMIAEALGVSYQTIYSWKKNLRGELEKLSEENRTQIQLSLFTTILKSQAALQAQLDVFTDKEWLRKQPAQELATLHGVVHDKSIRLLEAFAPDPSQDQELDDQ